MTNRWGNNGNSERLYFIGLQNHCRWWLQPEIKRCLLLGRKVMTNLDSMLKSETLFCRQRSIQSKLSFFQYRYELDHKKGWVSKNWCFWILVLERTFESPWDCKEIQPVSPKGNQPWIFIGRTDAKAEAPILWPLYVKSRLIGKDPDPGKDWRQEEKGMTEDEIVGCHH